MQANEPKRTCADLDLVYAKLSDVLSVNHNGNFNKQNAIKP